VQQRFNHCQPLRRLRHQPAPTTTKHHPPPTTTRPPPQHPGTPRDTQEHTETLRDTNGAPMRHQEHHGKHHTLKAPVACTLPHHLFMGLQLSADPTLHGTSPNRVNWPLPCRRAPQNRVKWPLPCHSSSQSGRLQVLRSLQRNLLNGNNTLMIPAGDATIIARRLATQRGTYLLARDTV